MFPESEAAAFMSPQSHCGVSFAEKPNSLTLAWHDPLCLVEEEMPSGPGTQWHVALLPGGRSLGNRWLSYFGPAEKFAKGFKSSLYNDTETALSSIVSSSIALSFELMP